MQGHREKAPNSAFGIRHTQDACYFWPLVLGDNPSAHIVHIPPGGGVPPYPELAQRLQIEHSLCLVSSRLKEVVRGESVTPVSHTAIRIPAGEVVEMIGEGETITTIYMAYARTAWDPSSPTEDRRAVTSLAETAPDRKRGEVVVVIGGDERHGWRCPDEGWRHERARPHLCSKPDGGRQRV